jgi:hypothetical protein
VGLTKRKTVKTGPYTRRTITQSSSGTRITTSSKPPGAATRRTVSTNLSTGKTRTTHTTKLGGGWFKTSSKTFSPVTKSRSKASNFSFFGGEKKSTQRNDTVYDDGEPGEFSLFWFILGIILLPLTIPALIFGPVITVIGYSILMIMWLS